MTTNIVQSISDEALAELEEHYTSEPVPACRVCGAPLSVSSIGGGRPTVWSCSNEAALIVDGKMDWDHYGKSQFEQRRTGDSRVVGLIARLRAAEVDAKRYRFLADNACDVIMSASMTDYGDGDIPSGPRVEIDPDQYPVETFGSAKLNLDFAIDAAMEQQP